MGKAGNALQEQLDKNSAAFVLPLGSKFPSNAAKEVMHSLLLSRLKREIYSADKASQLAKSLVVALREALADLCKPRYRIAVSVDLAEDRGQGMRVGCRCLWKEGVDAVASAVYRNDSIFCVATVYAVYLH